MFVGVEDDETLQVAGSVLFSGLATGDEVPNVGAECLEMNDVLIGVTVDGEKPTLGLDGDRDRHCSREASSAEDRDTDGV